MSPRPNLRIVGLLVVVGGCGSSVAGPSERNGEPFAHPGTGSSYLVSTTVSLDGSASWDPDGDAIGYEWTIDSRPPGSTAVLEDARSPVARLQLDAVGVFEVMLAVTDSSGQESTSRLRLFSEPPVIDLDAGIDRTTEWRIPVELSASIAVEADEPATVRWDLIERPDESSATIAGVDQAAASFVPDLTGRYVARITAETAYSSRSDDIVILAHARQQLLDYAPIAMVYADSLDRIVAISDAPPLLRLLDPVSGTETTISLPDAPRNLSLGLDGARVAVGHDNAVSIVSLEPSSIDQTVAVSTTIPGAVSCVLDSGDLVHCFSQSGAIEEIQTIDLVAGTTTVGERATQHTLPRLHPSASRIYGAYRFGSGVYRYDSSSLPVTFVGAVSEATLGRIWLTRDGASIITGTGVVLHSSDDPAIDMTRRATLADDRRIVWVAESPADGRFAAVAVDNPVDVDNRAIDTYDGETFELISRLPLPEALDQGQFYESTGEFAAYRSDGSELYLIAETDAGHALFTLEP